jgi:transposase
MILRDAISVLITCDTSYSNTLYQIEVKMSIAASQQQIFRSDDDKEVNNNANQQQTSTKPPKLQRYPLRDPTPDPSDLFIISRFEVPLLNYSATSDDIISFSLDHGPPVKWTFGTPDFDQEWAKIIWIGRHLEEAEKQVFKEAVEWSKADKYFWECVNHREYRMYAGIKMREHEFRGKVYVEGPFTGKEK